MLGLPKSTEFNKRLPKQKFYENLTITPALKKSFVDDIRMIYWRNKIAASTMNLAAGQIVTEIEVFEICLSTQTVNEAVLRQIDREIPYHILFLLEYASKYQAWIGYKEAITGSNAFKVNCYYHTDWLAEDELLLKAEGLNLDAVYESFVRQLAGDMLEDVEGVQETLQESVQRSERKAKLQKQIESLQAKIRKEKQLNRQMEMNAELKRIKNLLDKMDT
ncbi:DUF4391 domain-containing protein [Blautia obeum]|uniref:DUF4391 domain-containing protein n=1 Tax=Blautia obeum TaxID=40520 RepID=UPI00156E1AF8|nr:DUF4391 domain-containing protein [Blautia obeum]NSG38278.1 DUF4391 domain-containing protein [Blautia obeum]